MQPPSHVGLNALFLDPGRSAGPETYLRGLVPALAEVLPATRFTVVTTRRGARALHADGWTDFASLIAMPTDEGRRLSRLACEQVRLPWRARRRRWDVLHSLASLAPARVPGVATVVTLHDATFFRMPTFGRLTTLAMKGSVVPAARRADALLTGSEASRAEVCAVLGLDPARFVIAPHGAGRPVGATATPEAELRRRYDLAPAARVLLCVAAVRRHKNQALAVRALEHLPADLVLVLAGHPEAYAQEVMALARDLGVEARVRAPGYVGDEELEGLWRLASCAVLPTRAEGFGLPVLEALRRGVPVACSDLAVLREVGGDLPHYFDPDAPAGAAAAIVAALADGRAAVEGPRRADAFSWGAAAAATADAYGRALLAAGRR